jgi:hypothetical protein
MTLRWFAAITALALLGLGLLFLPIVRSDPLGGVAWVILALCVILGLIVIGVSSFVIRALVKSRRAIKADEVES